MPRAIPAAVISSALRRWSLFLGRLVQPGGPEKTLRGVTATPPFWPAPGSGRGGNSPAPPRAGRGGNAGNARRPCRAPASRRAPACYSLMNSDRLSTSSTVACLRPRPTSRSLRRTVESAVLHEVDERVGHVETRRVEHVGVALAGGDDQTRRFAPGGDGLCPCEGPGRIFSWARVSSWRLAARQADGHVICIRQDVLAQLHIDLRAKGKRRQDRPGDVLREGLDQPPGRGRWRRAHAPSRRRRNSSACARSGPPTFRQTLRRVAGSAKPSAAAARARSRSVTPMRTFSTRPATWISSGVIPRGNAPRARPARRSVPSVSP